MSQFVCRHPQLHDQLPDPHIWPGNVHLHLRIVDLTHQPIASNIREVPKDAEQGQRSRALCNLLVSQRFLSLKINPVTTNCCITRSPTPPPAPYPSPLQAHLPRLCPFQQRSSLMRSAAAFSSLQTVCGRATQKPRMGLSRSFSSATCTEAERY